METAFSLASTPQLHFGPEKIRALPSAIKAFGSRVLIVTGARSFVSTLSHANLTDELRSKEISFEHYAIHNEPTPSMIDDAVEKFFSFNPNVLVAIGGGSVLDAGKAIAAMLPLKEPVKNYLEGVGSKSHHSGLKVPFIAVPTTAGTGSEVTKNAVLSEVGESGYKKSLRHNNFVPNVAIVDPALTVSCSPSTTAASGMDAFTQLLESYVSTAANPITDALAYEGLKHISNSLRESYRDGTSIKARTGMSLAAYLSGITLANAGLGLVHGFASSIGGFFSIPHGVICSTLMAPVNIVTVRRLRSEMDHTGALQKYTAVGKIFSRTDHQSNEYYIDFLLNILRMWTAELNIPRLGHYGVKATDFARISTVTDNKNNPFPLRKEEMFEILEMAS